MWISRGTSRLPKRIPSFQCSKCHSTRPGNPYQMHQTPRTPNKRHTLPEAQVIRLVETSIWHPNSLARQLPYSDRPPHPVPCSLFPSRLPFPSNCNSPAPASEHPLVPRCLKHATSPGCLSVSKPSESRSERDEMRMLRQSP
jgi:hypothetical protein